MGICKEDLFYMVLVVYTYFRFLNPIFNDFCLYVDMETYA